MELYEYLSQFSAILFIMNLLYVFQVNSIESTPELRKTAMETLCALICQLGRKYLIFMPLVARTLNKCQYNYPPYDMLITYISSVCD